MQSQDGVMLGTGARSVAWVLIVSVVITMLWSSSRGVQPAPVVVVSHTDSPNSMQANHVKRLSCGLNDDFSVSDVDTLTRILEWMRAMENTRPASRIIGEARLTNEPPVCERWKEATWKQYLAADLVIKTPERGPVFEHRVHGASVLYLQNETSARRYPFPRLSPDEPQFTSKYRLFNFMSNGWLRQSGWNFDHETQFQRPEHFFVTMIPDVFVFENEFVAFCDPAGRRMKFHLASCMRELAFITLATKKNMVAQRMFPLQAPGHNSSNRSSASSVAVVPFGVPLVTSLIYALGGPYHMIVEHLTRIAPLVDLITTTDRGVDVRLVVTVPVAARPVLLQYLALMGIPMDRVVEATNGAYIHRVIHTPVQCYYPLAMGVESMRRVVLSRLSCQEEPSPKKQESARQLLVVFSERTNGSRHPRNYLIVKQLLVKLFGLASSSPLRPVVIRHITCVNVSSPVTIRAFSEADVIVGIHGANLVPLMFAKPGSVLVEIASRIHSACFYRLASMVGVRYAPVFHYGNYTHAPRVPVQEVVAQVGEALGFPLWATSDTTYDAVFADIMQHRVALSSNKNQWHCLRAGDRPVMNPGKKNHHFSAVLSSGRWGEKTLWIRWNKNNDSAMCVSGGMLRCGGCPRTTGLRFERLGVMANNVAVSILTDDGLGCVSSDGTVRSAPCGPADVWFLSGTPPMVYATPNSSTLEPS